MILSRVIEHVKQQHWTAIFIDFLIVVVGVFIGMQVTNWNEVRTERSLEAGYLGSLKEDIDYSTQKLRQMVQNMEEQQVARETLYAYVIDPGSTMEPAARDWLIFIGLFMLPQVDISEVTFETLKSSGRLSLLRSPALVTELQSLSANVASALRDQADEVQVTYLFSDPLLVANIDMAGVFRQKSLNGNNIPWLKDAPDTAPTPQAMRTQQFANAVLYRSFFTNGRLVSARSMLEQHQRIANLIKARQAELGGG